MGLIDNIINFCDKSILNWEKQFHAETALYNSGGNISYLTYERTLSSRMNLYLLDSFNNEKQYPFMVNEFAIQSKNIQSSDEIKASKETGAKRKSWNYCIFDGYFYFKDGIKNLDSMETCIKHLFVEYKLQTKFIYLDLANDYMKFKLFSKNLEQQSAFSYVVFDKNEYCPSIQHLVGSSHPKYCLLPKVINTGIPVTNVYIYYPSNINSLVTTNNENNLKDKLFEKINKLNEYTSKITELMDEYPIVSIEDDFNLQIAKYFNLNVMKSYTFQKNYSFIKKLWNACEEKKIFEDLIINNNLDDKVSLDKEFKEYARYHKNLERSMYDNSKIEAEKKGLHTSHYTSLNRLILLDYFNEKHNLIEDKPYYGGTSVGYGNNKESFSYEETATEKKASLKRHFSNETSEKKELRLVYSLLYVIMNTYSFLFEIDEEDNIVGPSSLSEKLDLIKKFDECFASLCKIIEFKEKISLEEIYNDETIMLQYVNHVFKRFE